MFNYQKKRKLRRAELQRKPVSTVKEPEDSSSVKKDTPGLVLPVTDPEKSQFKE